jgi:hypothetical protein
MTATVTDMPRAVSWRSGSNFGAWHLVAANNRTACGIVVVAVTKSERPLRDARGHVCKGCLAACRRALVEARS